MLKSMVKNMEWTGPMEPHGGSLVDLLIPVEAAQDWRSRQKSLVTLALDARSLADLEMLATGGFSPLLGFMGKADYNSVIDNMHLASGPVWTIPVVLGVPSEDASGF